MFKPSTDAAMELQICSLYLQGLSMDKVAIATKTSRIIVARVLRDHNIPSRSPAPHRPYSVNSSAFDNLSLEPAAYWLGFIFADGAVRRSNIFIGGSRKDLDHLRCLAAYLGTRPIQEYVVHGKRDYNCARVAISDRPLADTLWQLGIEPFRPNGCRLLDKVPKGTLHHFLRGWFDGDGSAHIRPQLTFVGRPAFLEKVGEIFVKEAGANPVRLKAIREQSAALVYRGIYRCRAITDFLYRDASIFLARKRKRILKWPLPIRARADRFCPTCGHPL